VAAQGDRAGSTRAPAVPRPKERLMTRRRHARAAGLLEKPRDLSQNLLDGLSAGQRVTVDVGSSVRCYYNY
jgi:hypothetical protein